MRTYDPLLAGTIDIAVRHFCEEIQLRHEETQMTFEGILIQARVGTRPDQVIAAWTHEWLKRRDAYFSVPEADLLERQALELRIAAWERVACTVQL